MYALFAPFLSQVLPPQCFTWFNYVQVLFQCILHHLLIYVTINWMQGLPDWSCGLADGLENWLTVSFSVQNSQPSR